MLPIRLRTRLLFEFTRVLIFQMPGIHALLVTWFDDARFRASMNASVISLQKLIERYLGIQADISELDGKPTDFLVSISGLVDEARMRSIIDTYKLAGKSYIFQSSAITYECEFTDYVCEDYSEVITVEFTDYVCEDNRIVTISVMITDITGETCTVEAVASANVKSELAISGVITGTDDNGHDFFAGNFSLTITVNGYYAITVSDITTVPEGTYRLTTVNVIPGSDTFYDYQIAL